MEVIGLKFAIEFVNTISGRLTSDANFSAPDTTSISSWVDNLIF
jgi:hypothetical protein